ncbi:Putative lipid kinase BmrU [Luteitalea pratensis]|uniref:Lipid kinase BmrU n=1 Tax=Luteitalea pratensis TaxID=1855912 RepID=A0A143PXD0_LUTPR|nr:diacylglycerol kinase family protein [Luteitalea pratensis]AMY12906.1 Putative lipid kinase BmrU [Luteitalea pratensis]
MTVDLIVNPASGPVVGRLPRRDRVHAVSHQLRTLGATTIRATETVGHGDAAEAVRRALDAGSDRVVVWGGDGTLNEVASSLLDTGMRLGVVPGGSGNGFARGLGLPLGLHAAVHVAMLGSPRDIDTGLVNGRSFLNLAGIGFDAAVAERFNTSNLRRGLVPYLTSILHEWRTAAPQHFRIRLDESMPIEIDADLVVVCNGQQYGHGARVAPEASFDDGLFDVVAVPRITAARILGHGWRLFSGTLAQVPGVFTGRARRVEVSQANAVPIHLDGEVANAETARTFEVRPGSLRIMAGNA